MKTLLLDCIVGLVWIRKTWYSDFVLIIVNKRWPEVMSKRLTDCSPTLSHHASVSIYLLCLEALVHFVDLFSASETISVAIGKGLILCKCMQITVTQNSIHNRSMQMMFAKQAYWKDPYFPSPTSHPSHPSALLPNPSCSALSLLQKWPCAFFSHFPFSPPPHPL